jgi:hypothetical protein
MKDAWELLLESIRTSSATADEKILILDSLQNYILSLQKPLL